MAVNIPYSKRMLIQRIRKYIANGFPNDSFATSDNEILLHIDQALTFNLVGNVWALSKIEGGMNVPEGYFSTFLLPAVQQDIVTKEWFSTLPQVPVGLPLGYSLDNLYFANSVNGKGNQVFLIKAKRVSYRKNMQRPLGVNAHVEGNKIILDASNGGSLLNQNLYARMATTSTTDMDASMNLPPDAIETIFNSTVAQLTKRYTEPKDIIRDELGSGNKSS